MDLNTQLKSKDKAGEDNLNKKDGKNPILKGESGYY